MSYIVADSQYIAVRPWPHPTRFSSVLQHPATDGKSYNVTYYNLDMIISLGHRIRSVIATHFQNVSSRGLRGWVTAGDDSPGDFPFPDVTVFRRDDFFIESRLSRRSFS